MESTGQYSGGQGRNFTIDPYPGKTLSWDQEIQGNAGNRTHSCCNNISHPGNTESICKQKKVWTYAGSGIMEKSSGGKLYSRKLTRDYNRLLKYSLKQAAESAISASDNPFRRHYLQMTLEKGIPPHRARLTVARSIVATLYGMWKSGGEYDPDIKEKIAGKKQTDSSNPSC